MRINYILNRIQKHNGFVYGQARLKKKRTQMILEIEIRVLPQNLWVIKGPTRV